MCLIIKGCADVHKQTERLIIHVIDIPLKQLKLL